MTRFHTTPTLACVFALPLFALSAVGAAKGPANPGSVVITVGGTPIKRSQIDTIAALMAKAQGVDPSRQKELEKLVATNLIGQELLEHEAKALKIQAGATELDSALRGFKSQFPDDATFKKALQQTGDNEAKLKDKMARQIRADKVIAGRVGPMEMPPEADHLEFWKKHQSEFPLNDSLRALQIVVIVDGKTSSQTADQKRHRLEDLRQEIARDTVPHTLIRRFMAAAAQVSEGPEAKTGGDLQRFHPNDFSTEFRKQVKALRVGQLSPVFKTPLGYHLILLIEKYDGKYDSYKLQITQNLMAQKAAKTGADLRKYLKGLAAKYPVKYLASAYKDSSEAGLYN